MSGATHELDAVLEERLFNRPGKWVDRVCINGTWREGQTWLRADENPADPGAGASCGMMPPHYSTTGDGMLMVVEAMRERGFHWSVDTKPPMWTAFFKGDDPVYMWGDTLLHAVALAALTALDQEAEA